MTERMELLKSSMKFLGLFVSYFILMSFLLNPLTGI